MARKDWNVFSRAFSRLQGGQGYSARDWGDGENDRFKMPLRCLRQATAQMRRRLVAWRESRFGDCVGLELSRVH